MKKFNILKGIPANLPMMNVDTDMIIPKQFLKTIKRTGLGKSLFFEMRYDEDGKKNKEFSKKISQIYRKLAKTYRWKIVDASGTKDDVHKKILKIIFQKIRI